MGSPGEDVSEHPAAYYSIPKIYVADSSETYSVTETTENSEEDGGSRFLSNILNVLLP